MIINEQSKQSREDLLKDNWLDAKPKDYNTTDYFPSKLGADGSRYYKRRDGKSISQSEVVSKEGTYITNVPAIKKIRIYKGKDENDEESLYLSSIYLEKIPLLKNYTISKLTPSKNNNKFVNLSVKISPVPRAT